MIEQKTASRLRTIRRAGLNRVKATARRQGIATVEQDIQTLRWIAAGSTTQAAAKLGTDVSNVCRMLAKYEKIAEDILARDARRPGKEN